MKRLPFLPPPPKIPASAERAPSKGAAQERILTAAHRCFEHFGVTKTTMEDVAQAAALSRQTVYKHFASKADLVTALCLQESYKLNAEIQRRIGRRRSLAGRITESVFTAVHFARENAYVRHMIEPNEIRTRLTDPSDPVFEVQRERWAPLLLQAQASGELAADLDLDEVVTWLTVAQMALLVLFEQPGRDDELEHMVRRFVVKPLLGKT